MKHLMKLFVCLAAVCGLVAAQPVSCPQYQHDNGAAGCAFNSYYDTPAYLAAENQAIADSLNASPTMLQGFLQVYGTLPLNQQSAIEKCQLAIVDAQIWPSLYSVPASCPVSNKQLNIPALLAATPAPTNPGNMPSVVWNSSTGQFVPVVPPQPGPAVPIAAPAPAPAGTNFVGPLAWGNTYLSTPAVMKTPTTAYVADGQQWTENGITYTAHVTQTVVGLSVLFTRP